MNSPADSLALSNLGADAGISSLNVADIPQNIRTGDATARQAYVQGLAFEDVLVNELTQQMSSTISGSTDGSSSSDYDSSAGGSSGSGLSGSGSSAFSSLIPQALTSGIMDDGGLGIADQLAASLDPSLAYATASTSGADTSAANSSDNDDSNAGGSTPGAGQVGL